MTEGRGQSELPARLPVVPLRSNMVYPTGVIGVQLGSKENLTVLADEREDLRVAVTLVFGEPDDPIDARSLEKIAVLARLSDRLNLPGGTVQTTMQGVERIRLSDVERDGSWFAVPEPALEQPASDDVAEELIGRILTVLEALSSGVERISREVPAILRMNIAEPGRFADLVASLANFSAGAKDQVVQHLDVEERLRFVLHELEGQIRRIREIAEAEGNAEEEENAQVSPAARANAIRHRIRMLRAELGEIDPAEREATHALLLIESTRLPPAVAAEARREVEQLRNVHPASPEAADMREYIDWLLDLPWLHSAVDVGGSVDLKHVRQVLDQDLRGLDEPKDRLLDYLAVANLREDLRGPIPCLVGPPDVGKFTLARSIASGLGRPLARLDLGGRGEDDIVGTRRTRRGARPGKLMEAMREVDVRDPLFLLEEVDLVGRGNVQGDPVEALEEALEWEGRQAFVDRYLDLPFDLTHTLFVATARDFYKIPRDLRELMVEVRIAGYTPEEKVEIARSHLLPRLTSSHGLEEDDVALDDAALFFLARSYARDSGVGLMQRNLSTLLRTRARAKADGELGTWDIDPTRVEELLGPPSYTSTPAENRPEVGVVTGLAWTAAGGELMFIEALRMAGTGRLIVTGRLGDVMRESVNAAYSWVRSRSSELDIPDDDFKESDLHVHFPVGATPKDGPSAGMAVTLAIASTLSGLPVRHDIAMSGEVTLRGKILQVGGVKEKVLAASRAGIRNIILPAGNQRDLKEVPDDVRSQSEFYWVERMEDVLELALLPASEGAAEQRREAISVTLDADAAGDEEPRAARSSGDTGDD